MKITIVQTITKTLDESRVLLNSNTRESYLIKPDAGKVLRHKTTGELAYAGVCLRQERKIAEYEEIDCPKASE